MMKRKAYLKDTIRGRFFAFLAAVLMLVMFTGCAGKNQGTLKWNRELDNKFVSYQVLPDHRYFITGGYSAPAAILAIHNDYQLENDTNLWVPVPEVSSGHMQKWIDNLSGDVNYWEAKPFMAADIFDSNGNKVGAWYSGQRDTLVKFSEGNRIKVYPPHLKPSFGGDDREKQSTKQ